MAVWQGSEQGQQSAEQAACERRGSCAGRLAVHSQGRAGGGIKGLQSLSYALLDRHFVLELLVHLSCAGGSFW